MPIFVRAGAIIPLDPVRQYTSQVVSEPTTLRVYRGADGQYTLYEDDGISQDYLAGKGAWTRMTWNERSARLTIEPGPPGGATNLHGSAHIHCRVDPRRHDPDRPVLRHGRSRSVRTSDVWRRQDEVIHEPH